MKKLSKKSAVVMGLALFMAGGIFFAVKNSELDIPKLVQKNHVELTTIAENIIQDKEVGEQTFHDVLEIRYDLLNNTVHFNCGGWGMGSETNYVGFYYSPIDKPTGCYMDNGKFVKEGKGWKIIGEGDNWEYTERIIEKWYSYKAHS